METTISWTHFDGKLYYVENIEQHTLSVVGAKDSLRNIVIPDTVEIDGVATNVNEIAAHAFDHHKLKTIMVGNNVQKICSHAFHGCTNLISVTLGDRLIKLSCGVFCGCVNLTRVNFPDSLRFIGPYAFATCFRLNDIFCDIQDPTQCKIGCDAFGWDELYQRVYLHVPDSIKVYRNHNEWGRFVHTESENPTQPQPNHIIGEEEGKYLIDVYGARYSLDSKTLLFVPKDTRSYEIIKGCENIAKEAFKGTLVETVSIPDTVTTIGDSAFEDCKNLYTITLPDSVKELGCSLFYGCERLTEVRLPRYIDGIHIHMFRNCKSLKAIFLPSGIEFIGVGAFENCSSLTSIVIPTMAVVESYAFVGCTSLKDVSLPLLTNLEYLGSNLFEDCTSIQKVYFPYDFFSDHMFANCQGLETIQISGKLSFIEDSAFICTNLRKVDFLCPVWDGFNEFENFWRFSANPNHEIEFLIPFGSEQIFANLFDLANKNANVKITVKPPK